MGRIRILFLSIAFLTVAFIHNASGQKRPNFKDNRSVIVHLFEWKWADIAKECEDFLGPMGYGGVQVSPANENLKVTSMNRPWWERYQPISYKLVTRSGDEAAFADMVKRCNDVGVRIYVDVLFNHMTGTWVENEGTGGSTVVFDEWSFPGVPYTKEHFNYPVCSIVDYNEPVQVRNCELGGLKDLNQTNVYVREKLIGFLNKMVGYGIAGVRVDAAKHVWPTDLKVIYDSMDNLNTSHGFPPNSRPYIYQEVIDFGGGAITYKEYTALGSVTEFKACPELGNCFRGQNPIRWLESWGEGWGLMPSDDAILFVDNHDNQRGHGAGGESVLTYKNPKEYKAATAFLLAHPYGVARIMSSFAFTDSEAGPPMDAQQNIVSPTINPDGSCGGGWVCEHRWTTMYQMAAFRNVASGAKMTNFWHNGNNQISFCRESRAFVAINIERWDLSENLMTCLPAGRYCDVISGKKQGGSCTGKTITVDAGGRADIQISASAEDAVLAIHIGDQSRLTENPNVCKA